MMYYVLTYDIFADGVWGHVRIFNFARLHLQTNFFSGIQEENCVKHRELLTLCRYTSSVSIHFDSDHLRNYWRLKKVPVSWS